MFHFPQPGERTNPSGIPISEDDAYWLLLGSGPAFVAFGEPEEWDEGQNAALLAWWNLMNGLSRDRALLCQKMIRAACDGRLPAAPWEEVAPDGTPL